ncbi:pentalenic acid synthase [Streptomyces sp. SceaMP-e96]|uniref:cytochrome P450 n=1 Tax=unclassified Streptomyces TaxID=2593676 RepID=UPI00082390C7|nr:MULTISPECIES: cytochrome P450 [unclassified Streptomyces]MYT12845.1 cytochrome P450 [Streptomyces sp. SID4951]SCK43386.1 pentalenic acid synthase [Streptomyces sp. SceaMP-e96]
MTEAIPYFQDRTCPYHPPAGYQPLREAGPLTHVTFYDGRKAWAVTGHTEARALLSDQRLSSDRQNPAFPIPFERFAAIRRVRTPLIGVDDPEHNTQRRMLIPSFSVKRIAALRPEIHRIVDGLLDRMLEQGPPAELVSAFALPVPSMVICSLLGVPYADHEFFEEESRRILRGRTAEEAEDARLKLEEYFTGLIAAKEKNPGDGLLDELIEERLRPGSLTHEELVRLAMILLVAGHETTANMISLGTFTLLEHPGHLDRLKAEEDLMPAAVEELMRFLSIADGVLRVAKEDIEIGGQIIRADDGVLFPTSLINRDDTVYPSPDELDLDRSARHHVAFGFGIHQCLGQNLARAEMEIALRSLFTRIPELRLAVPAAEIPFKPGDTLQGMIELPLAW